MVGCVAWLFLFDVLRFGAMVAADMVVVGPVITDRPGESGNLWERRCHESSELTVTTSIASAINLTASRLGAACASAAWSAGPAAQLQLTQAYWTASARLRRGPRSGDTPRVCLIQTRGWRDRKKP